MARRSDRATDAPLFAWGDALRAARARRRRLTRRAAALAVGATLLGATLVVPPVPRLVWNESASAPLGLYAVTPGAAIRRGDFVIARVPERYRALAAVRHYLPANVPLVKRAAGVAGAAVCAIDDRIYVDGYLAARRLDRDRAGRLLPRWTGCAHLRDGEAFLLMTDSPASFDGRYFGITEADEVVGRAQLLWRRCGYC